jgi:chaperone required for assembly of F1-ATPase
MSTDDFLNVFAGRPMGAVDPMMSARSNMRGNLPKRFYTDVAVIPAPEGFGIGLDGRPVKTPAKRLLTVPSRNVAEALAAEWRAQGERIDPSDMPLTCLVNAALDGVADQVEAVRAEIVAYAGNDALCYRAGDPPRLVDRQREVWDPILAWARSELGLRLVLAEGIMPVAQPMDSLAAAAVAVTEVPAPLGIAGLHSVTTLTGSAVLSLALWRRHLDADAAWDAGHLDEDFQIGVWGQDEEAAQRRASRRRQFDAAVLLLRNPDKRA